MKYNFLFYSMLVIFMIVGCSQETEVIENDESIDSSVGNVKYISQKPPQLKIRVDEVEFPAVLGSYDWSYFDKKENSMASVQAEMVAVSELIGQRKGLSVNSDTSIELEFAEEPITSQVNTRDSANHMTGSYKDVVLDGKSGRTIYEVVATWEQGTGHFFFPLTIE